MHQLLDRVREVDRGDVVVAPPDADPVGCEQHLGVGVPGRGLEAIGGELDQQTERVLEVDRVHEPPVLDPAVLDRALVEALHGLGEGRLREREREVVDAAGIGRCPLGVRRSPLVGEDGDQAAVARIEVEVALVGVVEVWLLEHEGHPEQALPEVDRGLTIGPHQRDVVDALALDLAHGGHRPFWVAAASGCSGEDDHRPSGTWARDGTAHGISSQDRLRRQSL